MTFTLYWLDTLYGCGGVLVNGMGHIVLAAPIYRRYLGYPLDAVVRRLRRRGWLRAIKEVSHNGR